MERCTWQGASGWTRSFSIPCPLPTGHELQLYRNFEPLAPADALVDEVPAPAA